MFITISIDLAKIDKAKIKAGKNGAKYYSLVIQDRKEPDQYGNNLTVTEPKAKGSTEKTAYLGSGKLWEDKQESKPAPAQAKHQAQTEDPGEHFGTETEDLPF